MQIRSAEYAKADFEKVAVRIIGNSKNLLEWSTNDILFYDSPTSPEGVFFVVKNYKP